jgi:hypothetical protein
MSQRKEAVPSFPLRLPRTLRNQVSKYSRLEGISLNQFIGLAVAEKIARLTTIPDNRDVTHAPHEITTQLRNGRTWPPA